MALEGAWGTSFAGGRGHLVLSGNYTTSPDCRIPGPGGLVEGHHPGAESRLYHRRQPALFIHQDHVGNIQVTQGGLIGANSAGGAGSTLAANALVGTCSSAPMARSRLSITARSMAAAATMVQRRRAHRCAALFSPGGALSPRHLVRVWQLSADGGHQGVAAAQLRPVRRTQLRRPAPGAVRRSAPTMPIWIPPSRHGSARCPMASMPPPAPPAPPPRQPSR